MADYYGTRTGEQIDAAVSEVNAAGNSVAARFTGHGAPAEISAARIGDFYIDVDSGALYIRTASAWQSIGIVPTTAGILKSNGQGGMVPAVAGTDYIKTLPAASTSTAGITKVGASGGAAAYSHTHTKSQITDFPTLATIATSGKLSDATADSTHRLVTDSEKSTWNSKAAGTHTHTKSQITDFPTLATVATSGSYSDLSNKPTIPTSLSQLTADSTHRTVTDTEKSTWNGKAAGSHTHTTANITDIPSKTSADAGKSLSVDADGNLYWKLTGSSSISVPTTNNVLKGDGQGGVAAATPGTDYIKTLPTASTSTAGITKVGASGGAAAYSHNHTISQITDLSDFLLNVYPVGSIYTSVNSTSPASLFGGTWEQLKDRFLLAAGDTYAAGATGGEATHTLTVSEMPRHQHNMMQANGSAGGSKGWPCNTVNNTYDYGWTNAALVSPTGGGSTHNNMPPYLTVYIWKRTA